MTGIVDRVKVVSERWGCSEQKCGERVLHWGQERKRRGMEGRRKERGVAACENEDGGCLLWLRRKGGSEGQTPRSTNRLAKGAKPFLVQSSAASPTVRHCAGRTVKGLGFVGKDRTCWLLLATG